MYFSATQLLTVALAGFAAAAPSRSSKRARSAVIGYRTVNRHEAKSIAEWGTFVDEHDVFRDGDHQLGWGKYISPNPGEWEVGLDNMYCIVWADADLYNSVSKVWIPEDHWWPNDEPSMKRYIESLSIEPRLSLRFSKIYGKTHLLQMLVPLELFEQYDNGIGIEAQCFDSIDELKEVESQTVDYNRSDIQNRNGPAHPTPPDPEPADPKPAAPAAPPAPPGLLAPRWRMVTFVRSLSRF